MMMFTSAGALAALTGLLLLAFMLVRFCRLGEFPFHSGPAHHRIPRLSIGQETLQFADQVRRFVATNADRGLLNNPITEGLT